MPFRLRASAAASHATSTRRFSRTTSIRLGAAVATFLATVPALYAVAANDGSAASQVIVRINAGGGAYTDASGNTWSADTDFIGGQTYTTGNPVGATSDPALYKSERYGMTGYDIPVPSNGVYTVKILESENYWLLPGQRVFSVTAEGMPFATNVDLAKQIGPRTAGAISGDVTVNDGVLSLRFSASVDQAKVDGIEVDASSASTPATTNKLITRIRAGGRAYTDASGNTWNADSGFIGGAALNLGGTVTGTPDSSLYTSERYGLTGYDIPVPESGTYLVRLLEAEDYWHGTRQRVFSVTANGQPLVSNLDLVDSVGYRHATTISGDVTVAGTTLSLRFASTQDNAKVDAIEVFEVVPTAGAGASSAPSPSGSGSATPSAPSSTSAAPSSPAPTMTTPTTVAPTTAAPTTAAPTTVVPTTVVPTTAAPTTTAPATSPAQPSSGCPNLSNAVTLRPGANIGAAVSSSPPNTEFALAAGTFSNQSIAAKAGDAFCGAGEGQTILDGGNQGMTAIYAPDGSADNVTVTNLTIQNYGFSQTQAYGSRFGAVDSDASSDRAQGWHVTHLDAEHNGFGILVGSNSYVAGNIVNNNSLYGLGAGSNNTIFEYNDITNNDLTLGGTGDSGGTKTAASTGVIYRYNKVVNNGDMGLWTDVQNINCTYDHNYLSGNHNSGIFHEISYNCSIHDNVVINNGNIDAPGWLYGGGISISSSGGINGGTVNVYNNYLVGNANGITVFQQNRGGPDPGVANHFARWCSQNVSVHDNTIIMTTGKNNGGVTGEGSGGDPVCAPITQAGNTWAGNSYYVNNTGGAYWQDTAGAESFSVWQSHGNDTAGSVKPASAAPAMPTFATGAGAFTG